MCSLETFKIDLKGMKEDERHLDFALDDNYFKALEQSAIEHGALHASASIRKAAGFFELQLHAEGTVTVQCDLCLDDMEQPVDARQSLIVKFGAADSSDDDSVTVDEDEGILDVAWYLYELIALAIPIKHVHAPGKCNRAMTEKLQELSVARSNDEDAPQTVDPRWSALLKLKE